MLLSTIFTTGVQIAVLRSAFFLGLWVLLLATPTVQAATYTVTTTADIDDGVCDSHCTLREAIDEANANPGDDTITFDGGVTGTITLSNILLLSTNLTISGPGASVLTIDGTVSADGRLFFVISGTTVTISGLTLQNTTQAILTGSTLTVRNVHFRQNGPDIGAAITTLSTSNLTVEGSTFSQNTGVGVDASCILIRGGPVTVLNSTFSQNTGGSAAIIRTGGGDDTVILNSTFSQNAPRNVTADGSWFFGGNIFKRATGGANVVGGGTVTSLGYNLLDDNSLPSVFDEPGDQLNTDPMLGPLQENDGPTPTHLPMPGSPAIDKGKELTGMGTDQRGRTRPQDDTSIAPASGGDNSDIGAVETFESLVVTTATDEYNGTSDPLLGSGTSLREAITYANARPGTDIITFASSMAGTGVVAFDSTGISDKTNVTGTILLGGMQLPTITDDMTISGPGASMLAIDGDATSRIFEVGGGTTVTISGLTITNGFVPSGNHGAGILNGGTLTVRNAVITQNNTASSLATGGGIRNNSTLTVENTTISQNTAINGGGIFNTSGSSATVVNSTISGNTANGGTGGGIYSGNTLLVQNTTISQNTAFQGGGITSFGATTTVQNATISENTATSGLGGGILNDGFIGDVTVSGTILTHGANGANLADDTSIGTITSQGYNLSDDDGGGFLTATGDQINTDPLLGPLQDNGGPTFTQIPTSPLSPAVDAIPADGGSKTSALGCGTSFSLDQRGQPRPADGNGDSTAACDIGAVEGQSAGELPVELTLFEALVDGEVVRLNWETASETNNAGFEIEHRRAENDAFVQLGFVEGFGTTLQPQSYRYPVAGLTVGSHVFRLKQVDYDGAFAYSPEVEVEITMAEAYQLSAAYPNPFNPETTFTLAVGQAQAVSVEVFNVLGQRVAVLHRGEVAANVSRVFRWEAGDHPSGLYFIRVAGAQFAETRQVMLMK